MKNIKSKLEQLGINDKESEIYLAILKIKKATIIQLTKITEIKRTTIYHCLDGLINKNLVNKIVEDDKKYYLAEDPKISFNNLIQEKKNMVNFVIPELKDIFGQGSHQPGIKIYHNTSGIKKIFEDVLNSKEKINRYYISGFDIDEILGEKFVNEFVKKRIKAKVKSLSLRPFKYKPKREKASSHAEQLRSIRFLPDTAQIKPYMCIYDNKVVIISSKEEKTGFIIESKEFALAQKTIFDMIWNNVAM